MTCTSTSTTRCGECPTISPLCIPGTCEDNMCGPMYGEYNEYRTCQCTFDCAEFGNCCEDADICLPMGCESHEDCGEGMYCDNQGMCYSEDICCSVLDSFDGVCPGDCSPECTAHSDC